MKKIFPIIGSFLALVVLVGQGKPPTTKPATAQSTFSFERIYDGMPPNLLPTNSDSTLKRQARAEWLKDNVFGKRLGPWELSGAVFDVKTIKQGENTRVQVMFSYTANFYNQRRLCMVTATLLDANVKEAMEWKAGSPISVKGFLVLAPSTRALDGVGDDPSEAIKMVDASAVVPSVAPVAPAPARRGGR